MAINNEEFHGGNQSRRSYLKSVIGTGLSFNVLAANRRWATGAESGSWIEQLQHTPDEVPLRRSLSSLLQSDPDGILDSYREAVRVMKELPDEDPRSWRNQAFIHEQGQHGNWLFLPWHRAYLFYFEEICRELSGNPDFALPYWDWIDDPQVPDPFEGGPDNPLYDPSRNITSSRNVALDIEITSVAFDSIVRLLGEPNFLSFGGGRPIPGRPLGSSSGNLEFGAHNIIHGHIGGNMGNVFTAPLDPLFWLHHCMIDYLWWGWNTILEHPNPDDPDWQHASFAGHFVDAQGQRVEDVSVLATLSMPTVYELMDGDPRPVTNDDEVTNLRSLSLGDRSIAQALDERHRSPFDHWSDADPEEGSEETATVDLELVDRVHLDRDLVVRVNHPIHVPTNVLVGDVRPYLTEEDRGRIGLMLTEILPPEHGDFLVRTFVNLPEATTDTDLESPHYAGEFSFLLAGEHTHDHDLSYVVDLTDTIYELDRRGVISGDEPLGVQFVATPFEGRDSDEEFTIGSLDLTVTRSIIDDEVVERNPREGILCPVESTDY